MTSIKVPLGRFVRHGIELHAGADPRATVRAAVYHYLRRVEGGRSAIAYPEFLVRAASRPGEGIEIALDCEAMAMLRRAAARQGVEPEWLAAHTVLVYLAELDFLTGGSGPAP